MTQIYDVLEKIKQNLSSNGITNTVTFGDITEVDLDKTTMYPLSHIVLGNVSFEERVMNVEVRVLCVDVVDVNKEEESEDMFYGNDNTQDILNTQIQVINGLQQELRRGDLYDDKFQLTSAITANPLFDNYENKLAGWGVDFSIVVANDNFSICNE